MRLLVRLELTDVYGGDGFTRAIKVTRQRLGRQRKEKRTRESIGVPVEDQTNEEKTEEKDDVVNTFEKSPAGKPLLRIGGVHGKLWGAMKEAGKRLASFGDPEFKSMAQVDRMRSALNVYPTQVELNGPTEERTLPQVLRGFGGMVIMRYDVIKKCDAVVHIEFPDVLEKQVRRMLAAVQRGGNFNKRRTSITVASIMQEAEEVTR